MEIIVPEAKVVIKIGAKSYEIAEPRLEDMQRFQKAIKETDGDQVKQSKAFPAFLKKLGMPDDVVDGLGIYQTKAIADGLMTPITEKK